MFGIFLIFDFGSKSVSYGPTVMCSDEPGELEKSVLMSEESIAG